MGCSVLPLKKTQPNHLLYLASIANICFKGIWFIFIFRGFFGRGGLYEDFCFGFLFGGRLSLEFQSLNEFAK